MLRSLRMPVALNHTIVHARDKRASAAFYAELLDLPPPVAMDPFLDVETHNGVTLAFLDTDQPIQVQHYAFLVTEAEFDAIFARIQARGLPHWDTPWRGKVGINTNDGGRGTYFEDPAGNLLEILTVPYGGWRR
jgi:catechol 2,3-dioxygenase-like lactoylglutathione lyase family enzyme